MSVSQQQKWQLCNISLRLMLDALARCCYHGPVVGAAQNGGQIVFVVPAYTDTAVE